MLLCVSVAPLGKPVVPLVNWMLMGSCASSVAATSATAGSSALPRAFQSAKRSMPCCSASPSVTTSRNSGRRAARSSPGAQLFSSGASSRSMAR